MNANDPDEPTADEIARVMAWLARKTSPKKAQSSAANGALGGRPRLPLSDIACTCGRSDDALHTSTCPRGRAQRNRARQGQ